MLIKSYRAALPCIYFQIYGHNAGLPRSLQNRSHQRSPDATLPRRRRDVHLLQPRDRTAMFHTQNRRNVSNSDDSAVLSRHQDKTTSRVAGHVFQYSCQCIVRCVNPKLPKMLDQQLRTSVGIVGCTRLDGECLHNTGALSALSFRLSSRFNVVQVELDEWAHLRRLPFGRFGLFRPGERKVPDFSGFPYLFEYRERFK